MLPVLAIADSMRALSASSLLISAVPCLCNANSPTAISAEGSDYVVRLRTQVCVCLFVCLFVCLLLSVAMAVVLVAAGCPLPQRLLWTCSLLCVMLMTCRRPWPRSAFAAYPQLSAVRPDPAHPSLCSMCCLLQSCLPCLLLLALCCEQRSLIAPLDVRVGRLSRTCCLYARCPCLCTRRAVLCSFPKERLSLAVPHLSSFPCLLCCQPARTQATYFARHILSLYQVAALDVGRQQAVFEALNRREASLLCSLCLGPGSEWQFHVKPLRHGVSVCLRSMCPHRGCSGGFAYCNAQPLCASRVLCSSRSSCPSCAFAAVCARVTVCFVRCASLLPPLSETGKVGLS